MLQVLLWHDRNVQKYSVRWVFRFCCIFDKRQQISHKNHKRQTLRPPTGHNSRTGLCFFRPQPRCPICAPPPPQLEHYVHPKKSWLLLLTMSTTVLPPSSFTTLTTRVPSNSCYKEKLARTLATCLTSGCRALRKPERRHGGTASE